VTTTGSDASGNGTEANPFASIQTAINSSSDGDTVLVQSGTYIENINYNGKNIVVGSLYLTTQDTSYISSTIIDGNQAGSVVTMSSNEPVTSEINGFTIQNGLNAFGGGFRMENGKGTLKNLNITNNGDDWGTAIYTDSELICEKVSIHANSGFMSAILVGNGSTSLKNVSIVNNNSSAIYTQNSAIVEIFNSTIANNIGNVNSNFQGNSSSSVSIINSIILDDYDKSTNSSLSFSYSTIEGGYSGTGNIDADPLFVDAANGNYLLSDYSPCIGAGLDTSIVPTNDIDGNARPNPAGSNPDIGAYENARAMPAEYIAISNDLLIVLEDSSSTIDLLDNDSLLNITSYTLAIVDSADNGTIALVGDTALTYTPNANFFGYDTVTYRAFGSEAADTGLVFITVNAVNDAPVASDASFITDEDAAVALTLPATDIDGDTLTYDVVDSPAYGTISSSTGPENSLSFDGSDDYVSVPSNSVYTVGDNYTIEALINSSSSSLQSLIQGWYGFGFQIYLETSGTIHFVLREPSGNGVGLSSTTQIADGNWHHIAAVLNEENVSVFVDGSLETEGTFDNTVTGNGSDNLSFGHSPWASEYHSGLLDEIRIWNTSRTQSEIQNNMSTELNGNETGLVGYWNFNEGSGSTVTDLTSNGNDGTI